jgi:hypothetical protein
LIRKRAISAGCFVLIVVLMVSLSISLISVKADPDPDWLSGWNKRVKITIDSNDVDSDLANFPVLVYLSSSSGRENDDVSFIFDELLANDNRKKIAVTTSDGVTQCYVEIEKWDHASEQAWLWVKAPSISNTSDTDLFLYYDVDQADNTDYVGDGGSTSAELVWDGNFMAVWHLSEITGGAGAIKDSTSSDNDGTDSGVSTLGATGKTGNAIHFDGIDDCVIIPDDDSLHLGSGLTIEAWINIDVWGNWEDIVFKGGGAASNSDYQFALVNTGLAWDGTYAGSWRTKYFPTSQDTGAWIYAVLTHDTVTVTCYRDGSEISAQSDAGAIYESTYQLGISREGATNRGYLEGIIDEARISNTTRSAAWITASYESERDDLLDYGSEEQIYTVTIMTRGLPFPYETHVYVDEVDQGPPYLGDGQSRVFIFYVGEGYNITVDQYVIDDAGTRYYCQATSGTTATSGDQNHTFTYITQYEVTFDIEGCGSDFTGTILTIGGIDYGYGDLPASFWWNEGSTHDFEFRSPLTVDGKRYVWSSTMGLSTSKIGPLTVSQSGNVTGNYGTQYPLTIATSPPDLEPPPIVTPSDHWYDEDTVVTCTAQEVAGYSFSYWIIDDINQETGMNPITITMNETHTAVAHYRQPVGGGIIQVSKLELLTPLIRYVCMAFALIVAAIAIRKNRCYHTPPT